MLRTIFMIALIFAALLGLLWLFYYITWKQAMKTLPREVGTVVGTEQTRIPFLMRNHILITRKGKPYYASSQMLLKKKAFRAGAKVPVAVQPVKVRGETVRIAYILQKRAA